MTILGTRGDPGFHLDLTEGYLGDNRGSISGDGSNVARWTFEGVTPGWHRIAVTWPDSSVRASDAQFAVLDGATPATAIVASGAAVTGIATIDQKSGPGRLPKRGRALAGAVEPGRSRPAALFSGQQVIHSPSN